MSDSDPWVDGEGLPLSEKWVLRADGGAELTFTVSDTTVGVRLRNPGIGTPEGQDLEAWAVFGRDSTARMVTDGSIADFVGALTSALGVVPLEQAVDIPAAAAAFTESNWANISHWLQAGCPEDSVDLNALGIIAEHAHQLVSYVQKVAREMGSRERHDIVSGEVNLWSNGLTPLGIEIRRILRSQNVR